MELIKKTVKAGNSSAVTLPRSWLNKEVRIELVKKSHKTILDETLAIIENYIKTKEIIGIYLTGSYSRNEENEISDIDILVITENESKEIIEEGIYSILIVSKKLIDYKLKNDLLPIGPMIKEAIPLLNNSYLKDIKNKIKITNKNTKWYINTTKEKIEIIRDWLENSNNKINDRIIYTLILRIRTLYIIQKLKQNKIPTKKEFLRIIEKIASNTAYERYVSIKNKEKEKSIISKKDAEKLLDYLEKQLIRIKN